MSTTDATTTSTSTTNAMMLPLELYYPIFRHLSLTIPYHGQIYLASLSTLSKSLQPIIESLLWSQISLLNTNLNSNPAVVSKRMELISRRMGKYVRKVEISLAYLVQWVLWDKTEPYPSLLFGHKPQLSSDALHHSISKLIATLNALPNVIHLRLVDMDDPPALSLSPEFSSIISHLMFPRLKHLYYRGSFAPALIPFLQNHKTIKSLCIEEDGVRGKHSFHGSASSSNLPSGASGEANICSGQPFLPNLLSLESTVPVIYRILPMLDVEVPLKHLTVSFGIPGSSSGLGFVAGPGGEGFKLGYGYYTTADAEDEQENEDSDSSEAIRAIREQVMRLEEQNCQLGSGVNPPRHLIFPSLRSLCLQNLTWRTYHLALCALLPRFPQVTQLSHVLISNSTLPSLLSVLPSTLSEMHSVYQGTLGREAFIALEDKLKEKCPRLNKLSVWAWTEGEWWFDLWMWKWEWRDGNGVKGVERGGDRRFESFWSSYQGETECYPSAQLLSTRLDGAGLMARLWT